jgi:hypothetical protein
MSNPYYEWARAEPRALARYVGAGMPAQLRLPDTVNRLDLLQEEGPIGLVRAIYQLLRQQAFDYDLEPFTPRRDAIQHVRTPATILDERRGSCLDLALLFGGLCLENDLVPLLVVVDGHAFAAVSRELARRDDAAQRPQYMAFDRGLLSDLATLRSLAERDYLVVECTGFAQSRSLSSQLPEGRGRDANGFMPFKRALEAGQEQVSQHTQAAGLADAGPSQRAFLYALDIADLQDSHGFAPEATADDRQARTPSPGIVQNQSGGINFGVGNRIGQVGDVVAGDKIGGDKVAGDKIDARNSQGFINRATGPISQNFGTQRTVNTGGGDYAEGNVDKRSGTFVGGDQYNMSGDFRGSNVNVGSTLSNVTQSINSMPHGDAAEKQQLKQLMVELNAALQRAPAGKQNEAEAVASFAKQLVDNASQPQPNKTMLQISGDMLKKAAENIEGALPIVLRIGAIVAKLVLL